MKTVDYKKQREERVARLEEERVGKKFGHLTCLGFDAVKTTKKNNEYIWKFRCDCGREISVKYSQVENGNRVYCDARTCSYSLEEHRCLTKNSRNSTIRSKVKAEVLKSLNIRQNNISICAICNTPHQKCPWISFNKPVEGWTATEKQFLMDRKNKVFVKTYVVRSCPLYTSYDIEKIINETTELEEKYYRYCMKMGIKYEPFREERKRYEKRVSLRDGRSWD